MGAQKIYTEVPYLDSYPIRHNGTKRAFDMIFSSLVILIGSPIFLFIALGIRLTSRGPIFYKHERAGRGGKTFQCLKFRTMYYKADLMLHSLLKNNPQFQKEWVVFRKLKNDPRVTPLGKFLRRTSLDELPQFFNVLKGDLSVVGPRPATHEELIKYYGPKAAKILSIRPGITGIWQVSGRSSNTLKERVDIDESYVDNHNFFQDLLLICKTIPVMFFSKVAY